MTRRATLIALLVMTAASVATVAMSVPDETRAARRRVTPVNNAATTTQTINEAKDDTARINSNRRNTWAHYHDDLGRVVYVDTVTGEEWMDSLMYLGGPGIPKMKYPLFQSVSVGVDIWDPVMRAFGQHYGLIGASVELNLHNRYLPTFEIGLGQAKSTPADGNFTYTSPLSTYFRIGADYNFLYNSSPDYRFVAGLRYGFAPFAYSVSDIKVDSPYWGETAIAAIPSQHATAGWLEIVLGLKVKLWRQISAGWHFRYRTILHQSAAPHGKPWYIPGYGSSQGSIGGSFSIFYTLPLNNKAPAAVDIETPQK